MRLEQVDGEVARIIRAELDRQNNTLELIASENHVSAPVLEALGSVLTDKYAEGYPQRRWYCGCDNMDDIEQLAIDRAKKLFGAEHANVQAHSGTSANLAVYLAALKPGETLMGMNLAHGGHLSHGHGVNISGAVYRSVTIAPSAPRRSGKEARSRSISSRIPSRRTTPRPVALKTSSGVISPACVPSWRRTFGPGFAPVGTG